MLKTFRIGGVHPPENKLSAGKPIEMFSLPQEVVIPIAQHIGAPATVVVNKGDRVKVGTLIARSSGFVSSQVHASVSGTVSRIEPIRDGSGLKKMAVVIQRDGDEWEEGIDPTDTLVRHIDLTTEQMKERIADRGIVGLGGATFPTHVKLTVMPGNQATHLIVNAAECEPYLTCDDALMCLHPNEIIFGILWTMKIIGVDKALIGIENNKPQAIRTLRNAIEQEKEQIGSASICVVPLKMKYPQGGEKQLIDALIRKQVKPGQLPISEGAVVQNVSTLYAIYQALAKNRPIIDRVVTVTGKEIPEPKNFQVRIGTATRLLVEAVGGLPETSGKVISGGPMMGRTIVTLDAPITKGSSGVLVLPEKESRRNEMRECVRCGKCVSVCPMGLNPAFIMRSTLNKEWEAAEKLYAPDCIECGSCSFTCPSQRPLLDHIRVAKQTVMALARARKK